MASVRNWRRMSFGSAPTAMRRPISRVRSVTETSMMFMMPTPPTTREIMATYRSSLVMSSVVELMAFVISVMSRTVKSFGARGPEMVVLPQHVGDLLDGGGDIRRAERALVRIWSTLANRMGWGTSASSLVDWVG